MVAPHTGDLIEQRLGRMGVFPDIHDREIGCHVGNRQGHKRNQHQQKHQDGNWRGNRHQPLVAAHGTPDGHHRLHQRKREGQDQGVMSEFYDHVLSRVHGGQLPGPPGPIGVR